MGVPSMVALRKESVDRNPDSVRPLSIAKRSLSARRAWIEIGVYYYPSDQPVVALRKESVDRNYGVLCLICNCQVVALRKESVDRNLYGVDVAPARRMSLSARRAWIEITDTISDYLRANSRSPQGERG